MHPLETIWARATCWIFKGNVHVCNLCGFGARRLRRRGHNHPVIVSKQISGAGRRRVDCPKCLSSDRDRILWDYLKNHHTVFHAAQNHSHSNDPQNRQVKSPPIETVRSSNQTEKPLSILHVAPEIPLSKKLRKLQAIKQIDYHCIDLKTPGYHYPKWVKNADLTELPFRDQQFDILIASNVLEHIPNLERALSEIHRTLKPSGIALLMFPVSLTQPTDNYYQPEDFLDNNTPEPTIQEKINRFGQHDHVRLFGVDTVSILSKNDMFDVFSYVYQNEEYTNNLSGPKNPEETNCLFLLKKYVIQATK